MDDVIKIMSRTVIVDGVNKGLCVVSMMSDGSVLELRPYASEEFAVRYVDTPIILRTQGHGLEIEGVNLLKV